MSIFLAMIFKPIIYIAMYFLIVAPIMAFFWLIIPNGRVKTFLFRERHM